jgi:dihydroceramide fatty acyl 2-hydroxylase
MARIVTASEIARLHSQGDLVLIVDGKAYRIPENFHHPGGFQASDLLLKSHHVPGGRFNSRSSQHFDMTPSAHLNALQLLENRSGGDISDIFRGEDSTFRHHHSNAARRMLSSFYLGDVTLNNAKPTPLGTAGWESFCIDESKPLLWQVGSLKEKYLEWVYQPVPGRPRFFRSDWAEHCTKVKFWVIPLVWLPLAAWSLRKAVTMGNLGALQLLYCILVGLIAWQGLEYGLHRFLFHIEPTHPVTIFLHFLLHGCHHKYPMDTDRLVFPPLPASIVALTLHRMLRAVAIPAEADALFGGMVLGYTLYDCVHYCMHAGLLGGRLRTVHLRHHYENHTAGFGISSPLFDWVFRTHQAPNGTGRIKHP